MALRDQTPTLGAVVTAMVTPFDEEGALDLGAAVELARWLVEHGSDGLVLAGTTGEGPVLSDAERADLWRAVAEAVTVPVVAGAGTNDTRHSIELVRTAAQIGLDGVLVVTPYYNRPSQAGLFDHFRAVAEASALPVVLYDIPARTGRRIATDTLLRLAHEVPNIVALKDAAGDVAGSARLMAEAPARFEVYSGDDAQTLPLLAVGAVGVVSVASHWAGIELGQVVGAFAKGDVNGARTANARLIESYAFESSDEFPNPLPAKAACRVLGLAVGQCRPPMGAAPAVLDDRAREVLGRLGTTETTGPPRG
ncbi:MAG TPA: 4-hydroxy-tetrahydrodipicolinate synthase [Acidimicrobiales bacterium]|nr:4-hydroxy-tetrahydrodipicolinate synthase [Acidimicrobiales bacterium]